MGKAQEREIRRAIQNPNDFRQHVISFPMARDYGSGWSVDEGSFLFQEREARMREMVALLLWRDKEGCLKINEPSQERIDSYCEKIYQSAIDHFKKKPSTPQMAVLLPCLTLEGKRMLRWLMFYNQALFESTSKKSVFTVLPPLDIDDPNSLLGAISAMSMKGNPVEMLRRVVAAKLDIELLDHQSPDGEIRDEIGELFGDREDPLDKIMRKAVRDIRGNHDQE